MAKLYYLTEGIKKVLNKRLMIAKDL